MNPKKCPGCGADDRFHDEIEAALSEPALEPQGRMEIAREARRRAGPVPAPGNADEPRRIIPMARGRETLLVAGLAAIVVLIVGAGLLFVPTDPGDTPPDKESAATPDGERRDEVPPAPDAPAPSDSPDPADGPGRVPAEPPEEAVETTPLPKRAPAPIGVLAGQVRTPDGRAVEGAKVNLWYAGSRIGMKLPEGQKSHHSVTSDPYGDFRFEGLPPGPWRLEVTHADFAPRTLSGLELTDGAGLSGVAVVLSGAGAIPGVSEDVGAVEGTVTNRAGEPVVGAVVTVSGHDGGGTSSARTDEEGNYRVDKLLPGGYRVEYREKIPGIATAEARKAARTKSQFTNVAPGEVTRVDFTGSGTLTGVALDAQGNPLADVIVRIAPLDEKGRHRGGAYRPTQIRTDKEGRFRIENAGEGRHTVGIQSTKSGDSFAVTLADVHLTGGDQEITLQLEDSGIMGRITVAETGEKPAGHVQISLYRVKPWAGAGMAFMDKEGRYHFKSIPPGKYRIYVSLAGYRKGRLDLELASGELKRDVDIVMEKKVPGTVIFRVKDQDGKPADGVSFIFNSEKSIWSTLFTDQTEPGVYVCKQLETGTWKVSPHRADLAPMTIEVKVVAGQTTEVDVVMKPRPPK